MENTNLDYENFKVPAEVMQALLGAASKGEIVLPMKGAIDYTRPLTEYASASEIATFLKQNPKTEHIYTKSLQVGGIAVQDKMENYLASDHYGGSTIKEMLVTPMNFQFATSNDSDELEKVKEKKGFWDLGTYLHQCILEPTKFKRVCVKPENAPMSSKDGVNKMIDFWINTINENGGGYDEKNEIIPPNECFIKAADDVAKLGHTMDKMEGMKIYCRSLEVLSGIAPISAEHFLKIKILEKHYNNYAGGILPRILKHSKREISMYATDPETNLPVKIRPDAIQFSENIGVNAVISIKSTGCKDLRAYAYRCAELHYDLSEGMYQEVASQVTGRDFNSTIMIMLQTVEPFAVAVLIWKPEDIEMGKYKYRVALRDIEKCLETGVFKGFEADAEDDNLGLINFELPYWNNKELTPKT